jgi:hypothetical protein
MAYGKLWRIYIVEGGYKRKPEPVASPQSTILYYIQQATPLKEGSRPQQHTWNSKALFFPAEKLFSGVNDTADKFIDGVVDTGDKKVLPILACLHLKIKIKQKFYL